MLYFYLILFLQASNWKWGSINTVLCNKVEWHREKKCWTIPTEMCLIPGGEAFVYNDDFKTLPVPRSLSQCSGGILALLSAQSLYLEDSHRPIGKSWSWVPSKNVILVLSLVIDWAINTFIFFLWSQLQSPLQYVLDHLLWPYEPSSKHGASYCCQKVFCIYQKLYSKLQMHMLFRQ